MDILVGAGVAIAEALQLNYVFLCEFEELHSELRDARSQVSSNQCHSAITTTYKAKNSAAIAMHNTSSMPQECSDLLLLQGGGVHGNGILSKFDLTDCRAIEHRCATLYCTCS